MNQRRPYERPTLKSVDRRRWHALIAALVVVDLVAISTALVAATVIRFGETGLHQGNAYGQWIAVWIPLWVISFFAVGLYDRHRTENPLEELRHIGQGVTIGTAVAVVLSFSVNFALSRGWAAIVWACGMVSVSLSRRVARKVIHLMRRRGRLRRRTLIVGTYPSARKLASDVERAEWEGLEIIGFVALDREEAIAASTEITVLGLVERLREIVVAERIDEVLVSPSISGAGFLSRVVAALDGVPVDLRVAPGLEGFLASRLAIHPLGDRALIALERAELRPGARFVKRGVDILAGVVIAALALPIIALAALAVRFDSKGPVFFRQVRVGRNGAQFKVWKLRTMVADAEERLSDLALSNEADGVLFKLRSDPRITRVGRILRKTSLDELPQIFNVLAGQMSLVGPRPPLPDEVAQYDDQLGRRLLVRPGITGLWQVSGRNELSFDDYVRYDLMYVQNWSLALDAWIMLKTVPAVLLQRGAY